MEYRILCNFLDAIDAELHTHADQQEAHDAGHGIYTGGTEDLADRVCQFEHAPADQAHQGKCRYHATIDGQALVLGRQLGNLGCSADHQCHGSRATHAGHGERNEGDALVDLHPAGLAGGGEQHAKTDKADDEAARQAQPRNGDPEQIQDGGADEEGDAEGAEEIDGSQIDLAAHMLARHPLAQPQQQSGRGGRVDHGQQCQQGE